MLEAANLVQGRCPAQGAPDGAVRSTKNCRCRCPKRLEAAIPKGRPGATGRLQPGLQEILPHLLLVCLALMLVALTIVKLTNVSLAATADITSLCAVGAIIMVARVSPHRFWSASAIYLFVLCLFHFGLAAVYGLGLPIGSATLANMSVWFYTPYTKEALILTGMGFVSCGIGILTALLWGTKRARFVPALASLESVSIDRAFLVAGFALVLVSVCGWFLIAVRAGGVGILFGSYETFLAVVGESITLTLTYYGINVGMVFLAAAQPTTLCRVAFAIFCLWSLVALPLGLRGEVLFPGLTALVIMAKRRPPFSAKVAFLLGLLLLSSIAALREVRQVGVQNVSSATVTASPLDALTELGSSLRPVSEVIYWKATGDQFIYGASYWAPFDRTLSKIVPGRDWTLPPAEEDPRVLGSLATLRGDGAIGFSVVAEAYRNFGPTGVCVIMALIGLLLGHLDLWPPTAGRQVLLGVILVPLLIEVRNDFTAVPFQILESCVVVYVVLLIARTIARARR